MRDRRQSRGRLEPFVRPEGRSPGTERLFTAFEASLPDSRYPPHDQDEFERSYFGKKAKRYGNKDTLDELAVPGYGSPGKF